MSRTTSGDPASIVGPSQPSPPASVAAQETASAESSHDYQAKHRAGGRALSSLMQPVRGRILAARIIVIASCVVALAPYLALVKLGTILLSAHIDHEALVHTANLLVAAFCTQALLYVLAVVITHFADLKLRSVLQGRIIGRLSRAPLAWFSSSSTGQVRKAIQDDTVQVHALVAHAPVEQTAAIGIPVVLLVYAFVVDWRLGLLCLATFPIYALLQWWSMRGMTAKTAEMNDKLANISANAIELTEGIHVVKNFGQTGKAHRRFTTACEEFARFYWDWCGPLIKASALSQSVISVPALMAINLGFGLLMARAGWVGVADVLTCSLIALVLPRTVEVLGSTAWMYQQAGGAALRLQEVLSIEQIDEPGTSSAIPEDTTVTFDDISVSYHTPDGEVPALNHVSLTLRPGTVTALVGPSGSGKSTLATMLARFRDPDFGTVRIGGVDLRSSPRPTFTDSSPSSCRTHTCSVNPSVTSLPWLAPMPPKNKFAMPPARPESSTTLMPCPPVSTPSWVRTPTCQVGRSSACPLRGPCWPMPRFSSWTRRLRPPIQTARPRSSRPWPLWLEAEPCWSSVITPSR